MNNTKVKYIEPPTIADHIALDMINTVAYSDDHIVDYWQTPQDVIHWLTKVAKIILPAQRSFSDQELFDNAVKLRNLIRKLIEQKKLNQLISFDELNSFLQIASSYYVITEQDKKILLNKQYHHFTAQQLLSPITEAAADLLANIDITLIKKCESNKCILWFYDKSKAHKRRWCSMSICGNRQKVSKFRAKHN